MENSTQLDVIKWFEKKYDLKLVYRDPYEFDDDDIRMLTQEEIRDVVSRYKINSVTSEDVEVFFDDMYGDDYILAATTESGELVSASECWEDKKMVKRIEKFVKKYRKLKIKRLLQTI